VKQFLFLLQCLVFNSFFAVAQNTDSLLLQNDSTQNINTYQQAQINIASYNKFINTKSPAPINTAIIKKHNSSQNAVFYLLAGLVLLLGIIKISFAKYFNILFRVFFNTSLRQSQLTDQLLIAKLPSLIFNLFFVITAGLYAYFLFAHFKWLLAGNMWLNILASITVVALIYTTKYLSLKFTGWVSGHKQQTDTYIFIIFLINKIVGIILVPFVVIIAFSDQYLVHIATLVSLAIVGILLFLRFIRGYELMRQNIKLSRFHFFLYIIGIEILPLLLVCKALLIFLTKNS
jgi:hypothetical protein